MTSVIKALPKVQASTPKSVIITTNTPIDSPVMTPKKHHEKTSLGIENKKEIELENIESATIDIDDIKAKETALYAIATDHLEKLKSVTYSLICPDDIVEIEHCLQVIKDSNCFIIKISNKSDKDRKLGISYQATF